MSSQPQTDYFETEIDELTVQPHAEDVVSLGYYSDESMPKGFLLYMAPEPQSEKSVKAQIFSTGSADHREFLLSVNNNSDLPASFSVELV